MLEEVCKSCFVASIVKSLLLFDHLLAAILYISQNVKAGHLPVNLKSDKTNATTARLLCSIPICRLTSFFKKI